jgi:hypothetical protein
MDVHSQDQHGAHPSFPSLHLSIAEKGEPFFFFFFFFVCLENFYKIVCTCQILKSIFQIIVVYKSKIKIIVIQTSCQYCHATIK